jgi:tryptophanyl-tRNA synthetase
MHNKAVFYNLDPVNPILFSSYLSSFLHLKKIISQQNTNHNFFLMFSDLQAMKNIDDRKIINNNIKNGLICLLANGITPVNQKINIFCQSAVLSHTNLAWFLSYVSPKNQSELLFVADILIHQTNFVATDINQIGGVNLTIDLAKKFNDKYNTNIFNIPTALLNPLNKPSNNLEIDRFFDITMLDNNDVIVNKIKNSNLVDTDIFYDHEKNPSISMLIDILSELTTISVDDIVLSIGTKGFSSFKDAIIEATILHITPIRNEANKLNSDLVYLANIIKNGNQKANFTTQNMMNKIKSVIGY